MWWRFIHNFDENPRQRILMLLIAVLGFIVMYKFW